MERVPNRHIGYPLDHFESPVSERLVCPICHCVFRSPSKLPCEHVFCSRCISTWVSQHGSCPCCHRLTAVHEVVPCDRLLQQVIDDLQVRCPLSSCRNCDSKDQSQIDACTWVGGVGSLSQHIEIDCPVAPVSCEFCSEIFPRCRIVDHISSGQCPCAPKVCSGCHQTFAASAHHLYQTHCDHCPSMEVSCELADAGCKWKGLRMLLTDHMQLCSFREVSCPFASYGCTHQCSAQDMKLHEVESSSFHLQLVAQVFTDALSGVEQDRRRVYEELEKSELRVVELETQVLCLQRELRDTSSMWGALVLRSSFESKTNHDKERSARSVVLPLCSPQVRDEKAPNTVSEENVFLCPLYGREKIPDPSSERVSPSVGRLDSTPSSAAAQRYSDVDDYEQDCDDSTAMQSFISTLNCTPSDSLCEELSTVISCVSRMTEAPTSHMITFRNRLVASDEDIVLYDQHDCSALHVTSLVHVDYLDRPVGLSLLREGSTSHASPSSTQVTAAISCQVVSGTENRLNLPSDVVKIIDKNGVQAFHSIFPTTDDQRRCEMYWSCESGVNLQYRDSLRTLSNSNFPGGSALCTSFCVRIPSREKAREGLHALSAEAKRLGDTSLLSSCRDALDIVEVLDGSSGLTCSPQPLAVEHLDLDTMMKQYGFAGCTRYYGFEVLIQSTGCFWDMCLGVSTVQKFSKQGMLGGRIPHSCALYSDGTVQSNMPVQVSAEELDSHESRTMRPVPRLASTGVPSFKVNSLNAAPAATDAPSPPSLLASLSKSKKVFQQGDRVAFLVDSFTGLIQFAVNRECVPSTFSRLCPGLFVPCCSTSWADVSIESVGKK